MPVARTAPSIGQTGCQQRGNCVGDGVRIQVVMKRVVTDTRLKADLDVILGTSRVRQDRTDLTTEVALHFQHKAADPESMQRHDQRILLFLGDLGRDEDAIRQVGVGFGEVEGAVLNARIRRLE